MKNLILLLICGIFGTLGSVKIVEKLSGKVVVSFQSPEIVVTVVLSILLTLILALIYLVLFKREK